MSKHPIQPLEEDKHGTIRFKKNAIVEFLLDNGGFNMNDLAVMDFSNEDRMQFAQLIGYSLYGFSELSYVDDATYYAARKNSGDPMADRLAYVEETLQEVRDGMRDVVSTLYGIHPEDLS